MTHATDAYKHNTIYHSIGTILLKHVHHNINMAPPMTTLTGEAFNRTQFEGLLKRRFFYTEAFEVYRKSSNFKGDTRGLYDYGPPGCALQANIVSEWRKHFVVEEDMLEVDIATITPERVLQTSGHVEKFSDWMCKDPVTGDYLRADHMVESVLEARIAKGQIDDAARQEYEATLAKIDNYDGPELGDLIQKFDIRNPNGNGKVEEPKAFNLMFKSNIGPSAASPAYLRPETAQGQFLNFKKLLDYNQGVMPFASACIGKAYRNEISPRSGLLRVREFLLAEVEHYVDPDSEKSHERFHDVANLQLPLLDRDTQLAGQTNVTMWHIDEAVEEKLIDNETLGYFLGRIYLFLIKIGADKTKIRFRQHLANEMAHYACDCWDAELLTSYGWIECVGCADRSAYDLSVHSKATGRPLTVRVPLDPPRTVTCWEPFVDMQLLGTRFKRDAREIRAAVYDLSQETLQDLATQLSQRQLYVTVPTEGLNSGRTSVVLKNDCFFITKETRIETTKVYTPNVIEPSFGIGRILYSVLEHVTWNRAQDAARQVLSLPVLVAPTKVLVAPLSNDPEHKLTAKKLARRLRTMGISNNVDLSSVSIGRKYARNDELGTPFAITIDFQTFEDGSVTLRERDSTAQVRALNDVVVEAVQKLADGLEIWEQVVERLPAFDTSTHRE